MADLPVVVIGAGPQGLAAAAHLLERGLEPLVLEAGDGSGGGGAGSGRMCGCSRRGRSWSTRRRPGCWQPTGWAAPTAGYPTGGEWIERYLAPLAAALGDRVRYGARVVGVSRRGRDRLVSAGREEQPFTVHVVGRMGGVPARGPGGDRRVRHLGAAGPGRCGRLAGDRGAGGRRRSVLLTYLPPTPAADGGLAGGHVVVVGSGHSAMTAVIDLAARSRHRAPG